jgi:YD repeat-containing protein
VTGTFAASPGAAAFIATRNSYDPAGRLVKVESGWLDAYPAESVAPSSWTGFRIARTIDYGYDAMDRKVWERVSSPEGVHALTETSYEKDGQVRCVALRMNLAVPPGTDACTRTAPGNDGPDRITRNLYDAAGGLLKVQKAYLTSLQQDYVTYEYSLTGKQSALIDANGNRAEMRYDALDRQQRWIFPSATTPGLANSDDYEEYGYDANGNRTTLRKRDGSTLGFEYDPLNRLAVKTVPASAAGAAGYTVFYAYDLRGLQTEARFGSPAGAGVSNTYDAAGRLTASTSTMGGVSRTVSNRYDADGERIRIDHPGGAFFTYDYAASALSEVKESGTAWGRETPTRPRATATMADSA